ncbi:hypothetical protein L7F22_045431 [Adiantum nelumboides]|nr:hypothetical protein [Adiantum nelumboides]
MAISELFGVGKSTVVETINAFINALLVHQRKFIAWPTSLFEKNKVKATFFARQGLPNVCGAMDVMERLQGELGLDWYDRNKNYSMLVQCVVDSNMQFMDVFVGFPGSIDDT